MMPGRRHREGRAVSDTSGATPPPLRVEDVMSDPVMPIAHTATLETAWQLMRERKVRHLPVIDADRRLAGIVTEHDLRVALLGPAVEEGPGSLAAALGRLRVNDVMTWGVITVGPGSELREAARIMRDRKVGALLVATEGRVVGILTATDVIEALIGRSVRRS